MDRPSSPDGSRRYPGLSTNSEASLHPAQRRAIKHIRDQAISLRSDAQETIRHILRMSNLPTSIYDELLSAVRHSARVAIHFHPDRPALGGSAVSRGLLDEGRYRSQFETGISNGSTSAHAGGARDEWERDLFGGAYHLDPGLDPDPDLEVPVAARPKYGALELTRASDGPAPRFGSCYLRLRPSVSHRCTFTAGGSQDAPRAKGTIDEMDAVLAAVLEDAFVRDAALGLVPVRPRGVVERILGLAKPAVGVGDWASRNLDQYVEAQVHGEVRLDRDVEEIVADPSFKDGETGRELLAISVRYGFPLRWHAGFNLAVEDVPTDFRGPTMPSLAARVARDGVVDARAIGDGVRSLTQKPEAWADRGTYAEVLQELKLLWHVLLRFGGPAAAVESTAKSVAGKLPGFHVVAARPEWGALNTPLVSRCEK